TYIPLASFNLSPTPVCYTLSLHDALPISHHRPTQQQQLDGEARVAAGAELRLELGERSEQPDQIGSREQGAVRSEQLLHRLGTRSEEHTSELQSPDHLVCRLLLEKKKQKK